MARISMMMNPHDPVHPNVAADLLGVTVDDVYERIRQGELTVRSVDGRWMVVLDGLVRPEVVNEPPEVTPVQQIDYRDELDQIRAQLQSLEAVVRDVVALQTPVEPVPVPEQQTLTERPVETTSRRNWQGLVVLGAIVALALAGSLVQSSSAQRSDDLTVVLIFVAGIVTGAIASWLALDRPAPRTPPPDPRRAQRISTTPQTSDSDS